MYSAMKKPSVYRVGSNLRDGKVALQNYRVIISPSQILVVPNDKPSGVELLEEFLQSLSELCPVAGCTNASLPSNSCVNGIFIGYPSCLITVRAEGRRKLPCKQSAWRIFKTETEEQTVVAEALSSSSSRQSSIEHFESSPAQLQMQQFTNPHCFALAINAQSCRIRCTGRPYSQGDRGGSKGCHLEPQIFQFSRLVRHTVPFKAHGRYTLPTFAQLRTPSPTLPW